MNQTTQQNSASSEELAATAAEMSSQAEQLQSTMSFFKVAVPALVDRGKRPGKASLAKKSAGGKGRLAAAASSTPGGVLSGGPLLAILGEDVPKEAGFTRF